MQKQAQKGDRALPVKVALSSLTGEHWDSTARCMEQEKGVQAAVSPVSVWVESLGIPYWALG